MKIKDCMCNEVWCMTPDKTVKECATLMSNKHIGCVPICDNSQNLVGLVTDRDIILRAVACNKDVNTTPVSEIMTCNVCSCSSDSDVTDAEDLMSENQVKRIPIIDNNKVVGILTLGDLCTNEQIDEEEVNCTLNNICGCNDKNAE